MYIKPHQEFLIRSWLQQFEQIEKSENYYENIVNDKFYPFFLFFNYWTLFNSTCQFEFHDRAYLIRMKMINPRNIDRDLTCDQRGKILIEKKEDNFHLCFFTENENALELEIESQNSYVKTIEAKFESVYTESEIFTLYKRDPKIKELLDLEYSNNKEIVDKQFEKFVNVTKKDLFDESFIIKLIKLNEYYEIINELNLPNCNKSKIYKKLKNGIISELVNKTTMELNFSKIQDVLYSIRCNLFHGGKSPYDQKDIEIINAALPFLNLFLKVHLNKLKSKIKI